MTSIPRDPVILRADQVDAEEVAWLWHGRIPLGRLTVLAGQQGLGKSFLTCEIAARLSVGDQLPDTSEPGVVGDTLLVTAEDGLGDTLRPRLEAAGADLERVYFLEGTKELETPEEAEEEKTALASDDASIRVSPFCLTQVEELEAAIDQLPDCKLVIIDPLGSFLGIGVDAYRDTDVRMRLGPIQALAERKGVAILLVCHVRKSNANHRPASADEMVLGTQGITALARSVLHLVAESEDSPNRLLLPGKMNLCKPPSGLGFRVSGENQDASVEWFSDPVPVTANGFMAGLHGPSDPVVQWLKDRLADGPVEVEILKADAEAEGIRWNPLSKRAKKLRVVRGPIVFGGSHYWRLPPSNTADTDETGKTDDTVADGIPEESSEALSDRQFELDLDGGTTEDVEAQTHG